MSNHYIKTLRLDLTTNSEKEVFEIQQEFSKLIRTKLSQKMEDIFDKFGKDQNIRIENLELEVQGVEAENWEEDFIKKFSQELITKLKELKSNSASSPSSTSSEKLSEWELFLFFLKKGTLPWYNKNLIINNLNNIIKKEMQSNESIMLLMNQIKNDSISLKRLINHLKTPVLDFIFDKCSKVENSFLPLYMILEKTFSKKWYRHKIKLEIWTIVFQNLLNNPPEIIGEEKFKNQLQLEVITKSLEYFSKKKIKIKASQKTKIKCDQKNKDLLFEELKLNFKNSKLELSDSVKVFFQQKKFPKKIFSKKEIPSKIKNQTSNFENQKDNMDAQTNEEIFIENAGLVLLGPYLTMLFEHIELLEDKNFKSEVEQNQAAMILQYLVSGNFSFMENELVLNKIICKIPIHEPIPTELHLDENQIELCDGLLNAVIQNWKSLGNTSIEGLRESFLNRNGKLTKNENGDWLLQVESKSFDILLESLPWTIGVIKFPWLKNILKVEWQ